MYSRCGRRKEGTANVASAAPSRMACVIKIFELRPVSCYVCGSKIADNIEHWLHRHLCESCYVSQLKCEVCIRQPGGDFSSQLPDFTSVISVMLEDLLL